MSWRVEWFEPAIQSLRQIPWRDAARVDAAVQRFAATSEGDVVRLPVDDAVTLRIRVRPYAARVTLDPIDGVLHVWIVYRIR
jgi:hypothetical protein